MGGSCNIDLYSCSKAYTNSSTTLTTSHHGVFVDLLEYMIVMRYIIIIDCRNHHGTLTVLRSRVVGQA